VYVCINAYLSVVVGVWVSVSLDKHFGVDFCI